MRTAVTLSLGSQSVVFADQQGSPAHVALSMVAAMRASRFLSFDPEGCTAAVTVELGADATSTMCVIPAKVKPGEGRRMVLALLADAAREVNHKQSQSD